ncbi:MAG: Uncharacterized protein G01um101472_303 [Parcubacteria group bacterium Gr01-1014_72]|nr:MAG: Uncharacterized protein G01um101472_303 [Parcubacteria group bacterium Gr01-1014_72]
MICAPWQRGQAVIVATVFFLLISLTIMFGIISPVLRHIESIAESGQSRGSFYTAEALNEDLLYRIEENMTVPPAPTLSLNGATAVGTITDVADGKEVLVTGTQAGLVRTLKSHLTFGSGASFFYGVQSGQGGITMINSSLVIGNLYSNGPVTGSNSNLVQGDVVSAGPAGLIDGVHATLSAWAHTILNSTIDKDAHYTTISNTTVGGTLFPGSPDQVPSPLPISDEQITLWENDALAGGTHTSPCPYSITGNVTLGPKKIDCDLNVSGSAVITLLGPLWVSGNIGISNSADVRIDPSVGSKSIAIIADNPSDRTAGSRITISNTTQFFGSGSPNSYVLLVSQNNSAEQGGGTDAIRISNSATGDLLLYAGHGKIELANSVSLKEVTAYKISLSNTAQVTYETGLASLLFTAGPGGGYVFDRWREVE